MRYDNYDAPARLASTRAAKYPRDMIPCDQGGFAHDDYATIWLTSIGVIECRRCKRRVLAMLHFYRLERGTHRVLGQDFDRMERLMDSPEYRAWTAYGERLWMGEGKP